MTQAQADHVEEVTLSVRHILVGYVRESDRIVPQGLCRVCRVTPVVVHRLTPHRCLPERLAALAPRLAGVINTLAGPTSIHIETAAVLGTAEEVLHVDELKHGHHRLVRGGEVHDRHADTRGLRR